MTRTTTGQGSLRQLPSPSYSTKRTVSSYSLSDDLRSERKSLSRETRRGVEVLKVTKVRVSRSATMTMIAGVSGDCLSHSLTHSLSHTHTLHPKNGKLQPRRVAFSHDNRSIIVTSNRIRSIKGLIKFVNPQSNEVTARGIDVSTIERIQRGKASNRFFMAQQQHNNSSSSTAADGGGQQQHQSTNGGNSSVLSNTNNCVSIVYRVPSDASPSFPEGIAVGGNHNTPKTVRGPHRFETLDLVIVKDKDYVSLVTALEDILSLYHEEIKQHDRDVLLLQYHWLDMELELSQRLLQSHWVGLCGRLGVPLKKSYLVSYYKDFCKEKDAEETGLDQKQTLELLEEIRGESRKAAGLSLRDDPIERLWLAIVETDPVPSVSYDGEDKKNELELVLSAQEETISPVAFLSFIRSKQKEYKTTLEQVQGLIYSLNSQGSSQVVSNKGQDNNRKNGGGKSDSKEIALADRLTKSRFVAYMTSDVNDVMHPEYGTVGACQMNEPLSHYWINTSHDTYLSKLPNAFIPLERSVAFHETVDAQMYMQALLRGVRCLEVDCWDGPHGKAVVARRQTANDELCIRFENVLQVLRCFLLSHPYSYPIILAIENHCSLGQQDGMAASLRDVLGKDKLLFLPTPQMLMESAALPSPEAMRGTVVIKGKRPKVIKAGAKVMNDDYDDDNDVLPVDTEPSAVVGDAHNRIGTQGNSGVDSPRGGSTRNDSTNTPNSKAGSVVSTNSNNPNSMDDDDGTEIDDEEVNGFVVGFEASGPVRTTERSSARKSPTDLLATAERQSSQARSEANAADRKARTLAREAEAAEKYASTLAKEAGLSVAQVKNKAVEEKKLTLTDEEGTELDIVSYTRSMDSNVSLMSPKSQAGSPTAGSPRFSPGSTNRSDDRQGQQHQHDEGIEVQDFFGDAVEGARSSYSVADTNAVEASAAATVALDALNEAQDELDRAKQELRFSHQREQAARVAAGKGAAEARAKREHAETARQRVETVRKMLRNSRESAASAETVVATALSESKISEQRAIHTEARASRALANAEKERDRADEETAREEALEQETSRLHEQYGEYCDEAKGARDRMEKAASMLDRVNEQIKLIESSTQYMKELRETKTTGMGSGRGDSGKGIGGRPRLGGKFIEKHAAKLDERDMCTNLIKEASNDHAAAEIKKRKAHALFEEKAQQWKIQADIASTARKQADRSSQHAEELAEHAEEEREAASLRHIAREKAQRGVEQSDTHRSSVEAQLVEATRASEEAASLALECRNNAERLAREALAAKDHSVALAAVEENQELVDAKTAEYEIALEKKRAAEEEAHEAKRLMDTSSEVYTNAKRDAAAEIQRANAVRMMEKSAVDAFGKAILCRKQAEHARTLAQMAQRTASDKASAAHHARVYKMRKDRINPISTNLAKLTLINSVSYKHWEKSHGLPQTSMHSFSQERFVQTLLKDDDEERSDRTEKTKTDFVGFTATHLMRTFPPWNPIYRVINADPTIPQALGCQMVSMNQHSSDEHLLVNDGRFRMNGSCGYVVKPPELLDLHLGAEERLPEQRWRFTIMSGYCLPRNESAIGRKPLSVGGSLSYVSPFVQVSLYEGALSKNKILHSTNVALKNGLNPVWDEDDDEFEFVVENPSIGVILFSVWDDETGDFMAASAVPTQCLREGYRSVALFDSMHSRSGPYAFSSLLVRSQKLID